jgi:16S rRNA (adenine1518-N6/adenine1519-N6)-dimethyltransferase
MKKNHAKKSLGQNFLWHRGTLEKILTAANLKPEETVLEIGPGEGFLTEALLGKGAHVTAIELDDRLIPVLTKKFKGNPRFKLIHADALTILPPKAPYKVVANLPYYITSPLLNHFLKNQPPSRRPTDMTVMVQKEVAEKICAQPGDMSVLAVHVQLFGTPKRVAKVPASHFRPAPKVDSAIIHIKTKNPDLTEEEVDNLLRVVHAGFAHKRKKLIRNLEALPIKKEVLKKTFQSLGISENTRAETLSIENWEGIQKWLFVDK